MNQIDWSAPYTGFVELIRQQIPTFTQSALTIGNFDGVHLGHQSLLHRLQQEAESLSDTQPTRSRSIVTLTLTFDPPPLYFLNPASLPPALTTLQQRVELLGRFVDRVVVIRTEPSLLQYSAEDFFDLIVEQFRPRLIVEGTNFHFGRGRQGDVALLAKLCERAGIRFVEAAAFERDGRVVSSSRVRAALAAGEVTEARACLGRPHRLIGTVVRGARRGNSIGFPTANLDQLQTLVPRDGVYAACVPFADRIYSAALNIGPNPTFGESKRKIEAHLIGFSGDLYGQTLAVDLLQRLRDTRSFASPSDLIAQLQTDVQRSRQIAEQEV